jgi:hypothetical protein
VYAFSIGTASRIQKVKTGGDGAFELRGCKDPPYTLDVLDPAGGRLLRVREVGPAPEELVLRLEPPGSLSGAFVAEGASPGAKLDAWLNRAGSEYLFRPEWDGELFSFPQLPPGAYRLTIRSGERRLHSSDWIRIGPNEHVDLGTIHGAVPGSLRVELESFPASLGIVLLDRGFDVVEFLERDGADLVARDLPPGEYFVCVEAQDMAVALRPVEIRPGEESRVSVSFEAGVARTLGFCPVDPAADWNWIRVAIRDEAGRLCLGRREERFARRPSVLARLAPGTFSVEAETDTGLVARGTFAVEALVEQDSPLVFELR